MNKIVILISPPTITAAGVSASLGGYEHLGLGYISASLKNNGFTTYIFYPQDDDDSIEGIINEIKRLRPIWVGISPTSFSLEWSLKISNEIKKHLDTYIVLGGHLATYMASEILEDSTYIDLIVLGEGEDTCVNLSKALFYKKSLEDINNIAFRQNGVTVLTNRKYIDNHLDTIPWPLRNFDVNQQTARISASRGCPYRCSFCTTPNFYSNFSCRSIDDLIKEMVYLNKVYSTNKYMFVDDVFFINSKQSIERMNNFANQLIKRLPNITFRAECRADTILSNIKLIEKLYNVGMKYIFVGLESYNQHDLELFNKGVESSTVNSIPLILEKIGISLIPGFIMFNKYTSLQDIINNVNYLKRSKLLYRTTVFTRTCLGFPGARLYYDMLDTNDFDSIRSNKYLLYPNFIDDYVRNLSYIFQEVELLYSSEDASLLNYKVYLLDELKRKIIEGSEFIGDKKINELSSIYNALQDLYEELIVKSIEIVKVNCFKSARNRIIDEFIEAKYKVRCFIDQIEQIGQMKKRLY